MSTATEIYAKVASLLTRIDVRDTAMSEWLTVPKDGGVNSDGMVTFTTIDGATFQYPSFQKIVSDLTKGDDARQDFAIFFGGNFGAGEVLGAYTAVADAEYDPSLSYAKSKGAPTSEAVITILKDGDPWGTVTFAVGSTVGVISVPDPTQARGEEIEFVAPPVHDPFFTNVSISFAGA